MARAIRPLPSSKGWMVTNQRCAIAALMIGSIFSSVLYHRQKCGHFSVELFGGGCLVVDPLSSIVARDDLHRSRRRAPPDSHRDLLHIAAARRKQRRMPAEQPLGSELGFELLGGVEHHFHNAFDAAVRRRQGARAPLPGRRASDERTALLVEFFSLDFAGLEDLLRQGGQDRLLPAGRKPGSASGQ